MQEIRKIEVKESPETTPVQPEQKTSLAKVALLAVLTGIVGIIIGFVICFFLAQPGKLSESMKGLMIKKKLFINTVIFLLF